MLRSIKFPLLARIAVAIVTGTIVGSFSPEWLSRIAATFNAVFSQLLGFMIPMIIIGFVAPAISDIGTKAGKLLLVTVLLAYTATFLAGLMSYFTGVLFFPSLISGQQFAEAPLATAVGIKPYFTIEIPSFISVTSSLVLAFMLGIGCASTASTALSQCLQDFREVVKLTINNIIIPLLPVYIFGIFLLMTVEGQIATILSCFIRIILVIFILHIAILAIQYTIAGIIVKKNPLSMLRTMMPAYFTALGTQSSAATIPVTLRQTIAMGVDKDIAGFTVPLCATIHMSGSILKITACALALLIMHGQPYEMATFIHFIAMLGITIIAAPGIPGGAIMASIGLLESILGFNPDMIALMIALYIAMDNFGTACNVTGDGALAAIIDKLFDKSPTKVMSNKSTL